MRNVSKKYLSREELKSLFESEYKDVREDYPCQSIGDDMAKLSKNYSYEIYIRLRRLCRVYYWEVTEDCLFCNNWNSYSYDEKKWEHVVEFKGVKRRFHGYLEISRFGFLNFDIRDMNIDAGDSPVVRTCRLRYRVKEKLSPINVVLELLPDENGEYCLGRYLIIKLTFYNNKDHLKDIIIGVASDNYYPLRSLTYEVVGANKAIEGLIPKQVMPNIVNDERFHQKVYRGLYEKYGDKLEEYDQVLRDIYIK